MNAHTIPWLCGAGLTCAVGHRALPAAAAIDAGVVRLRPLAGPRSSWRLYPAAVVPELPTEIDERVQRLLLDAVEGCRECMLTDRPSRLVVYAGWPDERRPGAPRWLGARELARRLEGILGVKLDVEDVKILRGDTAGLRALAAAHTRLKWDSDVSVCLVCAADSWINVRALRWLGPRRREITPGEAGVALWLRREPHGSCATRVLGGGVAPCSSSEEGLLVGAMVTAAQHALNEAEVTFDDVDVRVVDGGTLPSAYPEHMLAAARLRGRVRRSCRTLEPARQVGTAGAAAGLANVVVASYMLSQHRKTFALCMAGSDGAPRVAIVLGAAVEARPKGRSERGTPWAL